MRKDNELPCRHRVQLGPVAFPLQVVHGLCVWNQCDFMSCTLLMEFYEVVSSTLMTIMYVSICIFKTSGCTHTDI